MKKNKDLEQKISTACSLGKKQAGDMAVLKQNHWNARKFTLPDFQHYYQEHYPGMSRSEVKSLDAALYQAVRHRGLTSQVFPQSKNASHHDWDGFHVEKFRNYYHQHFEQKSRTEVAHDPQGKFLYAAVRARGLLDQVFPQSRHLQWNKWTLEKCRSYYEHHFPSWHRAKVQSHRRSKKFYAFLKRKKWVDLVLPAPLRKSWEDWTTDDFREEYQINYRGLGRHELKMDKKGGSALYRQLNVRGLLNEIIPLQRNLQGYYTDFEKVRGEVEVIMQERGRFPTIGDLRDGPRGLAAAVSEYHGGVTGLKIRMGYAEEEMKVIRQLMGAV